MVKQSITLVSLAILGVTIGLCVPDTSDTQGLLERSMENKNSPQECDDKLSKLEAILPTDLHPTSKISSPNPLPFSSKHPEQQRNPMPQITAAVWPKLLTSTQPDLNQDSFFLASLFPNLFASAFTISEPSQPIETNLSQYGYFLFCSIELFLSCSHILVHLGVKNSRYRFLTKQKIYFSVDGLLSTINLIVFWESYFIMRLFLLYAILAHAYYVFDLFTTNGKSSIFAWSAVDKAKNRFDLECFRENFETLVDDSCHFVGFLSAFLQLTFAFQISALVLGFGVLWALMVKAKFFFTKKHMMPSWLHGLIQEDSR